MKEVKIKLKNFILVVNDLVRSSGSNYRFPSSLTTTNIGTVRARDFAAAANILGAKIVEEDSYRTRIEFEYEKVANSKRWQRHAKENKGAIGFTRIRQKQEPEEVIHLADQGHQRVKLQVFFDATTKEPRRDVGGHGTLIYYLLYLSEL